MRETQNPLERQPDDGTNRRRWLFRLGIVAAICAAYFVGRGSQPSAAREAGTGRVLYYVDPMHPAYRSERPGKAPDCGMDLQPVYASSEPPARPGTVQLTAGEEQAIRLETEEAQMSSGTRRMRSVGRVAADEALTYGVSAGVDGWVRRVFSGRTGSQVKRGEALAAFFSKDISAPQQAYVYALESYERLKGLAAPPADQLRLATLQLARARDNLEFLGMGEAEIEELGRTRTEFSEITLSATAAGRILERHVTEGQRFMKGELLYRIANLDRVWVLADVPAGDAAWAGPIRGARIVADGLPPLRAEATATLPQFDDQGRTGKLRLAVNNPRGVLVPGMIVNIELEVPGQSALTVHADAVIDSGTAKRVFVARGDGRYELREVETGRQDGDRVEIRGGLKEGDRVVTAGAFLLDSESHMKSRQSSARQPR